MDDLSKVCQGSMIEQLVGQELLAFQHQSLSALHFWVREKKTSVAELDYLFPFEGKLIPIEVKSGSDGKLRSLHLFMDVAPHNIAVRFYSGQVSITKTKTPGGKSFNLLNLPYYAGLQIEKYLAWMQRQD